MCTSEAAKRSIAYDCKLYYYKSMLVNHYNIIKTVDKKINIFTEVNPLRWNIFLVDLCRKKFGRPRYMSYELWLRSFYKFVRHRQRYHYVIVVWGRERNFIAIVRSAHAWVDTLHRSSGIKSLRRDLRLEIVRRNVNIY